MFARIAWFISASLLLMPFQNCSFAGFGGKGEDERASLRSGGQPYDGKPFIVAGQCNDGTQVKARLILNSSESATLVREECMNIKERELGPSDFSFDSVSETVSYASQTYLPETPAVEVKPLLKAYMQWSNALIPFNGPGIFILDWKDTIQTDEIPRLSAAGVTAVCVITAGVTNTRDPMYTSYLAADKGKIQAGTTGDYWVDTRSANVRAILVQKLDQARQRGCRGVIYDQTDAYVNDSGFPLNEETAIDFLKFLAFSIHDRGLIAGIAHTGGLTSKMVNFFEFQFGQDCYAKGSCGRYQPFVGSGKPVLIADSGTYSAVRCEEARNSGFSLWFTTPNQDGSRYEPCP